MKRMPIKAAMDVAKAYGQRQVILLCWDGERTHVVTYGKTDEDCVQAAQGAGAIKLWLRWPAHLVKAEPSRLKKLKARAKALSELVRHAWVHSGQLDCGYDQMTTEQKILYCETVGRKEALPDLRKRLKELNG